MDKWEYTLQPINVDASNVMPSEARLRELGKLGWEVVAVLPARPAQHADARAGHAVTYLFVLKRKSGAG